jgi:hypothetical protein
MERILSVLLKSKKNPYMIRLRLPKISKAAYKLFPHEAL